MRFRLTLPLAHSIPEARARIGAVGPLGSLLLWSDGTEQTA